MWGKPNDSPYGKLTRQSEPTIEGSDSWLSFRPQKWTRPFKEDAFVKLLLSASIVRLNQADTCGDRVPVAKVPAQMRRGECIHYKRFVLLLSISGTRIAGLLSHQRNSSGVDHCNDQSSGAYVSFLGSPSLNSTNKSPWLGFRVSRAWS